VNAREQMLVRLKVKYNKNVELMVQESKIKPNSLRHQKLKLEEVRLHNQMEKLRKSLGLIIYVDNSKPWRLDTEEKNYGENYEEEAR